MAVGADPAAARDERAPRRVRKWWYVSAAEARMQATIAAAALWLVAGAILLTGSGHRSAFGPLKGTDFIQFYTLAHLDAQTAPSTLYEPESFHDLQTKLVPDSDPERYLIVYPPHVVLLFRPLAGLSYETALLLWDLVLAVGYALCVWLAWRPFRSVLGDGRLVAAAAAAFPPAYLLILHGQTSIVPMAAFCLGWMALERGRRFSAGAALGLLLLKPQFAVVLVPLVLFCREWAMLAGAAAIVATQLAATAAVLGTAVIRDYVSVLAELGTVNVLLEPRPSEMHSLSAITNQLPAVWGAAVWIVVAVCIVIQTIRIWRSAAPVSARMACLVVASLLVNPHLFSYDVVVLAPALVWYAAYLWRRIERHDDVRTVFACLYPLYFFLLVPTARAVPGAQASVLLMSALFVVMCRSLSRESAPVAATIVDRASAAGDAGDVPPSAAFTRVVRP
jgi:hypothetical protein